MADNRNKPATDGDPSSSSSFLGGGPKFNQAGYNTPMPGERVADAPPPPPFGGPRVWAGVAIVIVLITALWFVYGGGLGGVQSKGGHGGISASSRPDVNPDAPTQ